MTGHLEQPKAKAEQSLESPARFDSPLHSSALDQTLLAKAAPPPELRMRGDRIDVPEIQTPGWQRDVAAANNPKPTTYLEISNPYQGVDVAGRRWNLASASPIVDMAYWQNPIEGNLDLRDSRGRSVWEGYGQTRDNSFNPFSILGNAIDGVGKALWALTPFRNSVNNGRLGCAASVSEVLQRSGYDYANSAGVGGLESQLQRNGWRKASLDQAGPGDVVMVGRSSGWRAGGGSAHVGIVGENSSVYHNSSSRGQWIKDNLYARFGRGQEIFVLKAPGNGGQQVNPSAFAMNCEPTAVMAKRDQQQSFSPSADRQQPASRNGYRSRELADGNNTRYGDNRVQPRYDTYAQDSSSSRSTQDTTRVADNSDGINQDDRMLRNRRSMQDRIAAERMLRRQMRA